MVISQQRLGHSTKLDELRSLTRGILNTRLLSHFGIHFKHARVVLPQNEIAFKNPKKNILMTHIKLISWVGKREHIHELNSKYDDRFGKERRNKLRVKGPTELS